MGSVQKTSGHARRGDTVRAVRFTGRRVVLSNRGIKMKAPLGFRSGESVERGFSLMELVITITVMTILTMGVIPLVKVSVKRQKEQQLRETLRQMRTAIDQFHKEALIYNCAAVAQGGVNPQPQQQQQQQPQIDPRIKVAISDCTVFGVDNPDKYPPDLDTLVSGVDVMPISGFAGGRGQMGVDATKVGELATKKKVYLRAIPVDPMTGKAEWDLRSCYDAADTNSWGGENVFDVRSKSKDTALNGEKYSDW